MNSVYYESVHGFSSINGMEDCYARIICSNDNRYDTTLHWHNSLEIVLVLEGIVEYVADGMRYVTYPGQFHLINSGSIHAAKSCDPGGRINSLVIAISDVYLKKILPETNLCCFEVDHGSKVYNRILKSLEKLYPMVISTNVYKEFFIISELNKILYLLYENCQSKKRPSKVYSKEVFAFVVDNYAKPLSLESMAQAVGLQKNYFCRAFKKETGLSFNYYLNHIRLDAALSLMAGKKRTALECALISGFGSEKMLIEWCKKIYGCTPTEYLRISSNL